MTVMEEDPREVVLLVWCELSGLSVVWSSIASLHGCVPYQRQSVPSISKAL